MTAALYFPFSRCLDTVALKQAVLLYDELLFVDPVDPRARSALYTREARAAGVDPQISQRWLAAQHHYDALEQEGIVRTVDSSILLDPAATDELVDHGLTIDIDVNRANSLFKGRHRWQMLERRLPPSALQGRYHPRPAAPGWTGEPVVDVPYAVGASVNLTYALAIAHELGATPMTDSEPNHRLLLRRLSSAGAADGSLPGLHAAPTSPYKRRQIEVRLVDELAPAAALGRMHIDEVLDYRHATAPARRELSTWIDKLVAEAHGRPWDATLDEELERIARHAREIANQPGRWGSAVAAARAQMSASQVAASALALAAPSTVTAVVAPEVSLLGALAVGGTAMLSTGRSAVSAGVQELLRRRTPEQNAVAYLLNVRRR